MDFYRSSTDLMYKLFTIEGEIRPRACDKGVIIPSLNPKRGPSYIKLDFNDKKRKLIDWDLPVLMTNCSLLGSLPSPTRIEKLPLLCTQTSHSFIQYPTSVL